MFKIIFAGLSVWICLLISYALALNANLYVKEMDNIVFVIQLTLDLFAFVSAYFACRHRSHLPDYFFYVLLFVSMVPGLFSVTYPLFLVMQIIAWVYLLNTKLSHHERSLKDWFAYVPYIQSVFVILLSLISTAFIRNTIFHDFGISGTVDSLLETILYGILVFCLSRTKNKPLIIIEFGFLLLVAFNLAQRFSYLSSDTYKLFNVGWMLSLIIIIYGLILSSKSPQEHIELFIRNSIHVLSSSVSIIMTNVVLIAFIGFDLIISLQEIKEIGGLDIILMNTPAVLIFLHAFILFSVKLITEYFSRPLENMVIAIDRLDIKQSAQLDSSNNFRIYELKKFNAFIIKTINELQHANRIKSNFLMNMSHDFRTPASGIYNMACSLYKRIDDVAIKQHMRLIVDSSDKLMKSLDDILDYSRLDSGQYSADQEVCDIKVIINEVASILLPNAMEKGIKLNVIHKLPSKLGVNKRVLVHRVLLNIISNALKFTDNGMVTVTSAFGYLDDQRWLTIEIKDTGVGIDKIFQQSIFEPFYRIETNIALDNGGIGLGLSNVKAMLQKIGGRIEVMSELGSGSLFTVYLPILLSSRRSHKMRKNDDNFS